MRREFAYLGRRAEPSHQPFVIGLKLKERRIGPRLRDDCPRLVAAESRELSKSHDRRGAADRVERVLDVARHAIVDVADEAQREVIIFDVDPAGAEKSAAQPREAFPDFGRDLQGCEQSRHDLPPRADKTSSN